MNKKLYPKLRFEGYEEKLVENYLFDIQNNNNIFNKNTKLFYDAQSIMSLKYKKYSNQAFKMAPNDTIIFIKDGSNSGSFVYSNQSSKISSTCEYMRTVCNNKYIFRLIQSKEIYIKNKLIVGETIPHLYKKELLKLKINFPSLKEQTKIANFFSLLDKQIQLMERKIELYELKKKYYLNSFYKKIISNPDIKIILFTECFKRYDDRNIQLFKQFTVGKYGLKKIKNKIHDISNHKLIYKNSFVTGIGIEEMTVNLNYDNISCSPIYETYHINSKLLNPKFVHYFLIEFFFRNRGRICKKSTRREFEINNNWLKAIKLPYLDIEIQKTFSDVIFNMESHILLVKNKLLFIKKRKTYYLNNMFV